jgi:hypothetical protein
MATQELIDPQILQILANATCQEFNVKLNSPQLERSVYEQVDELLTRLGGKWKGGRAAAHVFPYDPAPLLKAVVGSGEWPPKNPYAFFPTPKPVIRRMWELADLSAEKIKDVGEILRPFRILEPSAGSGAIAEFIRSKILEWACPLEGEPCDVRDLIAYDLVEIQPLNVKMLRAKNLGEVYEQDFAHFKPEYKYDLVVMNPPFSVEGDKNAYITHIYQAWNLLEEGGIIVAVVPAAFTFRSDKTSLDFKEFVAKHGGYEMLPAQAFKESGTNVATALVTLSKKDNSWRKPASPESSGGRTKKGAVPDLQPMLENMTEAYQQKLKDADPVKVVVKMLDRAYDLMGTSYSSVFDRFVEFGIGALRVMPIELTWQAIEAGQIEMDWLDKLWCYKRYEEMCEYWRTDVCKGLSEDLISLFGQGVAVLNKAGDDYLKYGSGATAQGPDLLGPLYMEFVSGRHQQSSAGQFFTPWDVSLMMSEMTMGDCQPSGDGKPLSIMEPACGAGSLVLAAFDVIRRRNPKLIEEGNYYVWMIDIDRTCTLMAEFNLMLNRIPLYKREMGPDGKITETTLIEITTGNTLTLDFLSEDQKAAYFGMQTNQLEQRRHADPEYSPKPAKAVKKSTNNLPETESEESNKNLVFDWDEYNFKPENATPIVKPSKTAKPKPTPTIPVTAQPTMWDFLDGTGAVEEEREREEATVK